MGAEEAVANRHVWEQRWRQRDRAAFSFHLDEVPAELVTLLDRISPLEGPSLDLGCGACVVTSYLAERFPLAVGIDIAEPALAQATELVQDQATPPRFAASDAARLPFRTGSMQFVFDRGCLQNMPAADWPAYFREAARVLAVRGVLDLYVSKVMAAPVRSPRRAVAWARRAVTRREGLDALSPDYVRRLAPEHLHCDDVRELPFRTASGQPRIWVHATFTKRG